MHAPVAEGRVWVSGKQATPVIDAANAAYSAMLRCLNQLYETPALQGERRQALLGAALSCMKAVNVLGTGLTELPARDEEGSPRAGMSFALLRATEGPLSERALAILAERLSEIASRVATLEGPASMTEAREALSYAAKALRKAT